MNMKIVLVAVFVCSSVLGKSDAQTIQASGNLTNNGKIAVNYRPTFSVSFPSNQFSACSWEKNSDPQIQLYALGVGCLTSGSTAPDIVTCTVDTGTSPSTVVSTFSPPAPTTAPSNISMTLICSPNFQTTFLVTSSYCGNISGGVNQNVSANQGFGSSHTFTCMTPAYTGPSQDAVCQSDATWNITGGVCSAAMCDHSTVPPNTSYDAPSAGTTTYNEVLPLTCSANYTGSASAVCVGVNAWTVSNNCNLGTCNPNLIPSDISYTNSLTSDTLVGQQVSLECSQGYTGSAVASCVGPGQWSVQNCWAVCTVPATGTNGTFCSNTVAAFNITEGTPGFVYCCNNAPGSSEATCSHTRNLSSSLKCEVTTTPAATTTSAGATAFGSFWNGTPLVMLFVSVVCNHS